MSEAAASTPDRLPAEDTSAPGRLPAEGRLLNVAASMPKRLPACAHFRTAAARAEGKESPSFRALFKASL